jgi:hypothetical protein
MIAALGEEITGNGSTPIGEITCIFMFGISPRDGSVSDTVRWVSCLERQI